MRKIIFVIAVAAFYPFLARAEEIETIDIFKLSIGYGAGIIVMLVFVVGGFFISRQIRKKVNKLNKDNHEKTLQSREPAWKSDLQNSVSAQKQARIEPGQEKDQKKSP